MQELFRALAVHQARVHLHFLTAWKDAFPADRFEGIVDALVYDGLWLTKFPLHFRPTYGVERLSVFDRARRTGEPRLDAEAAALVKLVDADVLRFVLGLNEGALEARVEIFFGGRAMNKPLWNYLAAWFERSAVHRSRWGDPAGLLDTVFE